MEWPYCQQSAWNAVPWCNLKNDRKISVCFQGKSYNITVIQVYAPISNAGKDEVEWFYEDIQDLLEPILIKDVFFVIGGWNSKTGSQEILGVTRKFVLGVQNETGRRLTEFWEENALAIAKPSSKTWEMTLQMDITRCSIPKSNRLYSLQPKMENL